MKLVNLRYISQFLFQTFYNVLLYVQNVELPSTIDYVILTEMDAVTWLACLDLLQRKTGPHCTQKKKPYEVQV